MKPLRQTSGSGSIESRRRSTGSGSASPTGGGKRTGSQKSGFSLRVVPNDEDNPRSTTSSQRRISIERRSVGSGAPSSQLGLPGSVGGSSPLASVGIPGQVPAEGTTAKHRGSTSEDRLLRPGYNPDSKGSQLDASASVKSITSLTSSRRSGRASQVSSGSLIGRQPSRWSTRMGQLMGLARRKAGPPCRALCRTRSFQGIVFVALLCALFLPDIWILADRPNNSDLDVVLTIVLATFLFELVVQSLGMTRTYVGSFFFWMDLLGAFSLLLDLSYLEIMTVSSNVVIMRAARVAKLGARAGRFTRLVKLLRFLPGMKEAGADAGTAKMISSRLITALSTRVSCLIIVMVMVVPIFSMWTYPEEDGSMRSWLAVLEKTNDRDPGSFARQLMKFEHFYGDMGYYPYSLRAKPGVQLANTTALLLPWNSARGPPRRLANAVLHESSRLECDFNFKEPYRIDSLMNVLLLIVVMVLMVGFSLVLSNSVSAIVLRPLEKLLLQVRKMASTIFQSVSDMACTMRETDSETGDANDGDDMSQGGSFGNETDLLEKVVQKLAALSEITMNKSVVDAETLQGLGEGDRAVINGFQGHTEAEQQVWKASDEENGDDEDMENHLRAQWVMLENAGLSLDLVDSWNLNPLELDQARGHAVCLYFVGQHNHGVQVDHGTLGRFLEQVENGYLKCPYHNWFHAIDVTHGVYRFFNICASEAYLSQNERFALLVSAVCHDIGHPGLNNVFLVETAHELALTYNDRSPLENMHCAKMFELLAQPKTNIFQSLPKSQYQEVRKVSIEAILHTDNAKHFEMIKEVQMIYEVNSEILDASRDFIAEDPEHFPTVEVTTCFREPESRKLMVKVLLHLADISNSMKPFRICRLWAWQVLEEFFLQGDAEKSRGIPVQALNDRERVNRPFSQVGFIEFLVSPLVLSVIRVLPPLDPLAEQMIQNVRTWQYHWRHETQPPPSAQEEATMVDRVKRLEKKIADAMGNS